MDRTHTVAWAAGFVDGEGTVSLMGHAHGPARNRHEGHVKLLLSVSQTRLAPLEQLKALFGGAIYVQRHGTAVHRTGYAWRALGGMAYTALCEMEPFMLCKREQTAIAHEFMTGVNTHSWGGPPGMPTEEIARRSALVERMRAANRKGPRDTD